MKIKMLGDERRVYLTFPVKCLLCTGHTVADCEWLKWKAKFKSFWRPN